MHPQHNKKERKKIKPFAPYLASQTKIKSKWITDLNIKPKMSNILEENIRENLHDLELGKDLLDLRKKNIFPKVTSL
jgi:hypothetical protein